MATQKITFSLSNSLSELERLSERLSLIGERWSLPGKIILQLNLVLDELFTNVVSYGLESESEQEVHFTIAQREDEIEIVVSDGGRSFDPTRPPDPDLNLSLDDQPVGGLGIFLMRQYTDNIEYRRENEKNIVTLTKKI